MIIDLAESLSKRNFSEDVTVSFDRDVLHIMSEDYPILKKEPFEFHFVNEENRRLYVHAEGELQVAIPCDRCLRTTRVPFSLVIDRILHLSDGMIVIPEEESDTLAYPADGHSIDCDILVFDEILVNWPAKVLCRDDCKGLCPVCGQNLNDKDCGHDRFVPDPRMAGIQDLFQNFKEV